MKWIILMILMLPAVSALEVTEIMHSPSQGDDTSYEWIELHNNEDESIDLSKWKIDGSNFDDYFIMPGEYLVIAKKLLGNTSFERAWGNNDNSWNELDGFSAIDGSFSLTEVDVINLSNGSFSVVIYYDSSNNTQGATLILVNGSYIEGTINGTPGYPEFGEDEIPYLYDIPNSLPVITSIFIEDDYNESGIQVKALKNPRNIKIEINAYDENADKLDAFVIFEGKKEVLASINGNFKGNITIYPNSTTSNLSIFVSDGTYSTKEEVKIEIIKKRSYSLNKNSLSFIKTNNSGISTASFVIKNSGDKEETYYLSASGPGNIPEILIGGEWLSLTNEIKLPAIAPNDEEEIILRIKSNVIKKGKYYGKIKVRA